MSRHHDHHHQQQQPTIRNRKASGKQQTIINNQKPTRDNQQTKKSIIHNDQPQPSINHNKTKIKKSREKTCYCQALRISDTVFVIFRWSIHLLYGPLSEAVERLHYLQRCGWMVRAVLRQSWHCWSQHQTPKVKIYKMVCS